MDNLIRLIEEIEESGKANKEEMIEVLVDFLQDKYQTKLKDGKQLLIDALKNKIMKILYDSGSEIMIKGDVRGLFELTATESPFFDNAYFDLEIDGFILVKNNFISLTKKGVDKASNIRISH